MYIIQVVFGVQVHWFIAASIYLPPSRDALGHSEACPLPGFILLDQIWQFRTRPNQAHIPPYNIEQLGKFIQACPPQKPPELCDARISSGFMDQVAFFIELFNQVALLFGVRDHGTELENIEQTPILSNPLLAEEDRPWALQADDDSNHAHQDQAEWQHQD